MTWQLTAQGPHLSVRPLAASDFEALYAAAADPLVWQMHPEPDRHRVEVFRRYFDSGLQCRGALVVLEAKSGEVIGSSRFTAHDPARRSVEVGYTFLTRAHWGGAANAELKALMLSFAFERVDTVWFAVGERNLRSRRAVEKLGAAFDHAEGDHCFYRLEASTWAGSPLRGLASVAP